MSRQYLQYSPNKMEASGLCLNSTFNRHNKGRLVSVYHMLESCQRRSQAWISKVISLHYHELYMGHGIYEHYIEITFSGYRRWVNWINLLESKIIDLGGKPRMQTEWESVPRGVRELIHATPGDSLNLSESKLESPKHPLRRTITKTAAIPFVVRVSGGITHHQKKADLWSKRNPVLLKDSMYLTP